MKQKQAATTRRALVASLIGSSIEYYDYLLFGTMASLVFGKLFFPTLDSFAGLLLAYASFGIPYFFRPLGGIIFSHIGDRIGRKKTLVLTLALMGLSTVLIGCLPNYETIGIWAPILLVLLRLVQGIGIGGEWGGALLLAVEYSPKNKRGFGGSIPMMGSAVGMLLGTVTVSIMGLLPEQQFMSWGWRVPFLLSVVLVFVGLWIRRGLEETPDFQEIKESGNVSKFPLAETFRHYRKEVLLTIGVKLVESAPFYIFATFVISYATGQLHMDKVSVLNAVTLGTLFSAFVIPFTGILADRIGRKRIFILGTSGMILFAFPYFHLLSYQSVFTLTLATVLGMGLWGVITAVMGTLVSDMFGTRVRYTGISIGYQVGAALAGGMAPLIATALIHSFNGSWLPVGIFLIVIGAISLVSALFVPSSIPPVYSTSDRI
ncbi:MFS transporter [Brevibacillus choshinensis]|uniref:MHS family MFS transporter n=1 Tax=Brevibacillus choshinensis TaxID=54911 RepID=A0ABX7FL56_BRECH|nr:MFS transporter [Brevibacillus choshinensis]QRG66570.1 MHS family MFS transporter [Brevibacillus choshinensis]